jgi:ankyrin repeat protein
MKSRFDHLRRCKRGRISKEKRLRSRFISRESARRHSSWETRTNSVTSREHFTHAFRDYTKLSSYDVPTSLSRDLANSEPVYSSLLLLDGSSLPATSDSLEEIIAKEFSGDHHTGDSPFDFRDEVFWSTAKSPTGTRTRDHEISSKRTSSIIRRIGKQLGHKYSAAYLKHVKSVLRYSSSNSWRSSLGSLSSRASTFMSRTAAHDTSNTVAIENTVEEQNIWDELIDEGRLEPQILLRPEYLSVLLFNRLCCSRLLSASAVCAICGFTPQHRQAMESASISLRDTGVPPFKTWVDVYENTPLHCAAASVGHDDFWKIRNIIRQGVDVHRCNTFGETFLHILCRKGPKTRKDTDEFLLLLMDLLKVGFHFHRRDYYGRTILHILFQHSESHVYDDLVLQQILSIIKPHLNMQDNSGSSLKDHLAGTCGMHMKDKWLKPAALLAPLHSSSVNSTHFHRTEYRLQTETDVENFLKQSGLSHVAAWVDAAGDTPLLSLLKNWRNDSKDSKLWDAVNQLLISGTVVEMRDRNGDTALAIAARRGFRSTVLLLLEAGANVHARNYQRIGILKQIEKAMDLVTEDSRLWARTCSCYVALSDAGAISSPSDNDEWKSRYARNFVASPRWSEQSHTVHEPPEGDLPPHWLGSGYDVS